MARPNASAVLKDKVIIVSGGASGLGAETVGELCGFGARVIVADLNSEDGERVAAAMKERALFVQTDVTSDDSAKKLFMTAETQMGPVFGLVNCAGIGTAEKVVNKEGFLQPLDRFAKVIEVNLIGAFNLIRYMALATHRQGLAHGQERGVIVNTASVAAFDGQVGQSAYAASKGGIVAMTLPLAREFAPFGVRVMSIAPGIFDTPMLQGLPEKAKASLCEQVPFPPRLGQPLEYAQLVRHIFENKMLNGEVIRLDGALRMAAR